MLYAEEIMPEYFNPSNEILIDKGFVLDNVIYLKEPAVDRRRFEDRPAADKQPEPMARRPKIRPDLARKRTHLIWPSAASNGASKRAVRPPIKNAV